MQTRTAHSSSSVISYKPKVDPSAKRKDKADENLGIPSEIGPIERSSPYLRTTAKNGSKPSFDPNRRSSKSITQSDPSDALARMTPAIVACIPSDGQVNNACTFLDSVISLCSKSRKTCSDISLPVPGEDMFLLLVRECGVIEARYWAITMGFPHEQSYALLEALLYGQNRKHHAGALS